MKLLIVILFLIPLFCRAQITSLEFNHYGVNEGLTQGNVTCIMQDHMGLMWFGTWDGLNVFDGFKNTTFSDPSFNSAGTRGILINNIIEIDSNQVAIATNSGLTIFNRKIQKFEYYSKSLSDNNTRLLKVSGSRLMLTINDVLYEFGLKNKQFKQANETLSVHWAAMQNKRLHGVNRSELLYSRLFSVLETNAELFDQIASVSATLVINDLITDFENNRIFLACDEGLFEYDIRNKTKGEAIIDQAIKCLGKLNDLIYAGSQKQGLYVYDPNSDTISANYTYSEIGKRSVTGNFIRTMFIDRNENLWISVLGNGINYCSLKPKIANTIFSYSDLPSELKQNSYIKSIVETKDSLLWVATVTGQIWVLNNNNNIVKTILPEDIDKNLKPNSIQRLYVNKHNQIFILTEKGLFRATNEYKFQHAESLDMDESQKYFQAITSIDDSTYMIGSRKGLFVYNSASNKITPFVNNYFQENNIHYLFKDNHDRIYVNSQYNGMDVCLIQNNLLNKISRINFDFNVKSCYEKNDTLIFATTKGILILDKNTLGYRLIDENNGLPNQNIYCVLPDNKDTDAYWCSSNHGIFKYNIRSGNIFTVGLNDGLSSLEFNTGSFAQRLNGQFVFGSIDGMTSLNPEKILRTWNSNELIVYNLIFDKLTAEELSQNKCDSTYSVSYDHNGFSCRLLQINYPNFTTPIRYKLTGHDRDWINGINPIEIRYSNLEEGNYKFEVQRYDREKGWVLQTMFKLELLPPWYRSWWAYLIYVLISSGVIITINRIYVNRKLRHQRELLMRREILLTERDRISADLHDDVGSTLSSISIFSEAIKNKIKRNDFDKAILLASEIGDNARRTIDNLSDIVWSINPANDRGERTISRMQSFAATMLSSNNIHLDFDCDVELMNLEFGIETRQNLYLIYKEAINNITKHSGATQVKIKISITGKLIILNISDNGRGIQKPLSDLTAQSLGGNGLRNMRRRAAAIHGNLLVDSNSHGLHIKLEFEYKA